MKRNLMQTTANALGRGRKFRFTLFLAVVILAIIGLALFVTNSRRSDSVSAVEDNPRERPIVARITRVQSSGGSAASGSGAEMGLTLTAGGFCVGNQCYAATASGFELAVEVKTSPAAGYVGVQAYLDYGIFDPTANEDGAGPNSCGDGIENGLGDGADRLDDDCVMVDLVYSPTINPEDEILWPDLDIASAVRAQPGPGLLVHGGLTGLVPPLSGSSNEGVFLAIKMTCPVFATQVPVSLLIYDDPIAGTDGALFAESDGTTKVVPKVSSITLNCVSPQPFPGDTDGDGCADAREEGSNPALGGDRDFLNPWDFYDVYGDRQVNLLGDVLPVIQHYSPGGAPPYDVIYDRGPWLGAKSWNDTLPPDGVIDRLNDNNGVIAQNGHNCT